VSPRGPTEEGGHLCYSFVCLGELLGLLSCEWGDLWCARASCLVSGAIEVASMVGNP
jgi:hypothetical protein